MDKRIALFAFVINIGVLECTVCKDGTCTNNMTCPVDKPFKQCCTNSIQTISTTGSCRYICVSKCNHDQILDGTKCINVTDCHKAIVFQDECLDLCPVGYVFSYDVTVSTYGDNTHSLADLKLRPCITITSLRLTVAGFAVAMVAYIVFLLGFFSLKSFSFKSIKKYFLSLCKRKQKKTTDTDSDESDSDEEMISTAGNHMDYDDENILL